MADPEKLSQQPIGQAPGDEGDLFYCVQSGQTRRMPRNLLRAGIVAGWAAFIGTFLGASTAPAARAAIGAISAADSISGSAATAAKWTTPRTLTASGDIDWSVSVDGSGNVAAAATVNRKVSPDYISGLQLQWVSANALTVGIGAAMVNGALLTAASAIAKTGLTLAATSKFHVYLYSNAGVPDIEIVATAPSAKVFGNARTKTGDVTRRYLGTVFTAAANTIIRFKHDAQQQYVRLLAPVPAAALTSGTSLASTAIAFTSYVPETTTRVTIDFNTANTNAAVAYLVDGDLGAVNTGNYQMSAGPNQKFVAELSVSETGKSVNYAYDLAPTPAGLTIRVLGYHFER